MGRDKGAEQREVERGGGGLLSNHRRFREVAGPFLPVPLREDFFFFFKYIYKGTVHTPTLAGCVVTALSWGPVEVRAVGGRLVATCAVGKATGTGGTFSAPEGKGKKACRRVWGHSLALLPASIRLLQPPLLLGFNIMTRRCPGTFLSIFSPQDPRNSPASASASPLRILCWFSFLI